MALSKGFRSSRVRTPRYQLASLSIPAEASVRSSTRSREAVSKFLETMNEHDEAFLITFNQQAKLQSGFTSNRKQIEDKLVGVESNGYTALLDAVNVGLEEMKKAKNARKALLIVSDGGDNISHYTPREIASVVRKADVQIYCLGVFDPLSLRLSAEEIGGPKLLAKLSEQTGGRIFAVESDSRLAAAAEKIGIELRNQYLLAYSTTNQDSDGSYREIEVKVIVPKELPPSRLGGDTATTLQRDEVLLALLYLCPATPRRGAAISGLDIGGLLGIIKGGPTRHGHRRPNRHSYGSWKAGTPDRRNARRRPGSEWQNGINSENPRWPHKDRYRIVEDRVWKHTAGSSGKGRWWSRGPMG